MGSRLWPYSMATFVVTFGACLAVLSLMPALYDFDSSFHLAAARLYLEQGLRPELPWARFSVMSEGWGDKSLLFHWLLVPFASLSNPLLAAKLALSCLNAAFAATLAHFSMRAVGRIGLLIPLWLLATAADVDLRLLRLRPETLSLLLLIAAVWAAHEHRYRLLGGIACVYTLSYTAFQAFVGLCLVWCLFDWWTTRKLRWPLLLYPLLGTLLGVLVHPQFPSNVKIWVVQSVEFFRFKDVLDVGAEIFPASTRDTLINNLGWWLGIGVLWRSGDATTSDRQCRMRDLLLLTTLCFALLTCLMWRFASYFYPLATLALLYEIRRRGVTLGAPVRLPWGRRVPFALAFGVCFAGVFVTVPITRGALRVARVLDAKNYDDWQRLARAIPDRAKVVTDWGVAELLALWAPQGRYLNVLDPVFMYVHDQTAHDALGDILANKEPDPPLAAATVLDSDYIAGGRELEPSGLARRLAADPRLDAIAGSGHHLWRIVPGRNRVFVLDWRRLPDQGPIAAVDAGAVARGQRYPRLRARRARAVEGFVNGRRLGQAKACMRFARVAKGARSSTTHFELAPYGPTQVWLDGKLLIAINGVPQAQLGLGAVFPVRWQAAEQVLVVRTCPVRGRIGFYLRPIERGGR